MDPNVKAIYRTLLIQQKNADKSLHEKIAKARRGEISASQLEVAFEKHARTTANRGSKVAKRVQALLKK